MAAPAPADAASAGPAAGRLDRVRGVAAGPGRLARAPTVLLHRLPAGQLADRFAKVTSYGTMDVLDRARIRETLIPLAVLAGGTTAMGAFGAMQLNKAAGTTINTSGVVQQVICLAVGALAMLAAITGSRPLLRKVTAGPAQTAD